MLLNKKKKPNVLDVLLKKKRCITFLIFKKGPKTRETASYLKNVLVKLNTLHLKLKT